MGTSRQIIQAVAPVIPPPSGSLESPVIPNPNRVDTCNNRYISLRYDCYKLMATESQKWTLLVYRIPAQPTRLRLQIWRRLQKMGALYLQNAVCLLPSRP